MIENDSFKIASRYPRHQWVKSGAEGGSSSKVWETRTIVPPAPQMNILPPAHKYAAIPVVGFHLLMNLVSFIYVGHPVR